MRTEGERLIRDRIETTGHVTTEFAASATKSELSAASEKSFSLSSRDSSLIMQNSRNNAKQQATRLTSLSCQLDLPRLSFAVCAASEAPNVRRNWHDL